MTDDETRPVSYYSTPGPGRTWLDARDRYDELSQRDLHARSIAILKARGEYDPASHGHEDTEPLTLSEHIELLANGEVVARVYRHPAQLHQAVQAGASFQQIADATGSSVAQVRQDYRDWAKGQHRLWRDYEGRFGLDDAAYTEAMQRADGAEGEADA